MSLNAILAGISGVQGIAGLMGASSAKKQAQARQQQALVDLSKQLDDEYRQTVENNSRGLYSATGVGGDAIAALGRRLGDSMAGAGVYNSSATAGALTQAQGDQNTALANLASTNRYNEQSLLGQNQRYLTNAKLGVAGDQIGQANGDLGGARNSLQSFLGALSQFNLRQNNVTSSRAAGPAMNGNQNAALAGINPLESTPTFQMTKMQRNQVLNVPKFGYSASGAAGSLFGGR